MRMSRSSFGTSVAVPFALSTLLLGAGAASAAAPPDAWITTKSKIALVTTSHIGSKSVHVDTFDGRVTLHGKVTTALQKENAESVVKSIDGVKSVRNLLQVVSDASDKVTEERDDRIKEAAAQVWKADPELSRSSIAVKSVDKGVVLLTGKAKNLSEYLLAVESVSGVAGVRQVHSEVKATEQMVESGMSHAGGASKDAALDSWITMSTKMRLLADGAVPALNVSVDTYRGSVTLFGMVPTAEAKAAAVADAKKTDSVVSVNDELQVVATVGPEQKERMEAKDDISERDVLTAFKSHAELRRVGVSVKNGVAHLNGTVKTGWQRLEAATLARSVRGIRSVEDDVHF